MEEPYTIALTSCGRFDLLEKTLASLISHLEQSPEKIIVIEDSGDYKVENIMDRFQNESGLHIETIVNPENIGQVRSIDRLYSRIETEWVFHCEDDWEFIDSQFLQSSYLLMKNYDSCSTVNLDGGGGKTTNFVTDVVTDKTFLVSNRDSPWSGFIFQPGLRRMRDYRIVGPYSLLSRKMDEVRVSHAYKNLGYRVLVSKIPYIRHLGDGRHVTDSSWEKSCVNRQIRSTKIRMDQIRFWLNPELDPYVHVKRRWEVARQSMKNWVIWD